MYLAVNLEEIYLAEKMQKAYNNAMSYEIHSSQDWPRLERTIQQNLRQATDSPVEIHRILANIQREVSELARMEVEQRRRARPTVSYLEKVDKINRDLLQLEKIVMLATLWR